MCRHSVVVHSMPSSQLLLTVLFNLILAHVCASPCQLNEGILMKTYMSSTSSVQQIYYRAAHSHSLTSSESKAYQWPESHQLLDVCQCIIADPGLSQGQRN